jgi:hypothetical protein
VEVLSRAENGWSSHVKVIQSVCLFAPACDLHFKDGK